jgi:hypothetical protein
LTDVYLSRPEAAAYLSARGFPIAKATLQKYACIGGGPIYRRFGNRTLYLAADLDTWATEKLGPAKTATYADAPRSPRQRLQLR